MNQLVTLIDSAATASEINRLLIIRFCSACHKERPPHPGELFGRRGRGEAQKTTLGAKSIFCDRIRKGKFLPDARKAVPDARKSVAFEITPCKTMATREAKVVSPARSASPGRRMRQDPYRMCGALLAGAGHRQRKLFVG